jgi:ankyrin repeat protein
LNLNSKNNKNHFEKNVIFSALNYSLFHQQVLQGLFSGIQGGDIGSILNSISGGADVNAKDEQHGMTPLQMAIMAGLTEIVKVKLLIYFYYYY